LVRIANRVGKVVRVNRDNVDTKVWSFGWAVVATRSKRLSGLAQTFVKDITCPLQSDDGASVQVLLQDIVFVSRKENVSKFS
jgi:hypothetical protein